MGHLGLALKDKDTEIMVSEVDEAACLLRMETNRERFLKAIENVEKAENQVEVKSPAGSSRTRGSTWEFIST
jgi:hypothetical protein